METNTYQSISKSYTKFYCEKCDYNCSKQSLWTKHCLTTKHINTYQNLLDPYKKVSQNYPCKCGKNYLHKQSLYNHKKKCNYEHNETNVNNVNNIDYDIKILTNMVLEVVKQNQELMIQNSETQKQNQELTNKLFEICKNGTSNTNNSHNTTTNSHNKSFNLQFFLNETCKDAMNIMDFVDSIKLQLSDLEKVGEIGYVDGISNIIVKNLNALEVEKRPVHCTDKKREVLYIKHENKWEKEDDEKKKLRKAIKRVACKNQRMIPKFKEAHPDCIKASSKFSDQYNKMIIESMGGSGDNDLEKEDKIIKNISKNVIIDKNMMVKDTT